MSLSRQYQKASVVTKTAVQANGSSPKVKSLELSMIRTNGGTQSRSGIDAAVAQDYSEELAEGASFPPVVVFHDGETYWLADGFHRYRAYELARKKKIPAEVRQGTRREAVLFSVGANATHGLQRTRADKRRSVELLLNDPEWSSWSDREIARRCAVSRELVGAMREDVTVSSDSERTYRTKHGTVSTMDTSSIGRSDGTGESTAQRSDDPNVSGGETEDPSTTSEPAFERVEDEKEARQAEWDRQREEAASSLPENIKQHEKAKADAVATRKTKPADVEALIAENDELREANAALEAEVATLKADNAKWEAMRVQFEQGGFEKVIAGKDEEIRALLTRLETESREKVSNLRAADRWRKRAIDLGYSDREVIEVNG